MHEIPNAIAIPSEAIVPEMGKSKVYLYKNGKKLKKLKCSSYRLPEDTSMTLTMTNKKTKVVETLKFDYADFGDYNLDIY